MSGHTIYLNIGSIFSRIFSTKYNPLYHLGTLAIYFFAVAFISGVYLFLFYTVDPTQAYNSTKEMTEHWFNNVMRNLHRYSSDAFVVFVFLHFLHMLLVGKFKKAKSWIFGLIALFITLFIGLTGFILVWDEKAKLLGLLTAKLLIYLPFFDPSIAGAFLNNDLAYLGGIFRVTLFGHIFFCAFTAIFLWLHVVHLTKPSIFPPRKMMIFSGFFILAISILFDAHLDAPAQNSILPVNAGFNWFYFFGYYFMSVLPVGGNWLLILSIVTFCCSFPFLFKTKKAPSPLIDHNQCDGCGQCAEDCPYDAITITTNEAGEEKAFLDESKCVSCNICVGSCKSFAIASEDVYPDLIKSASVKPHQIFTCKSLTNRLEGISTENASITELTCIGDIHAKMLDDKSTADGNKLVVVGCESCYYRFGTDWAEKRLNRKRRPVIKPSTRYENILFVTSGQNIKKEVNAFLADNSEKERKKKLEIKDFSKINFPVAMAMSIVFFLAIPFFSNQKIEFYTPEERTLILNFKYTSSPVMSTLESKSQLSHMQSPVPIITRRSSIKVEAFNEKQQLVFSKIYDPRGIRKDIAIFTYDEVLVPENISIVLTEIDFPDVKHTLENIRLNAGESNVLVFEAGHFQLIKAPKAVVAEKIKN
jgi:ferredoxin